MSDVVLEFPTRSDAYGYVSESRRLATSLLWDVQVERAGDVWVVRIPEEVVGRSPADALERFNGVVVAQDGRPA